MIVEDFVASMEYMCFEKQSMVLKEMGLIHMYRPSLKGISCEQVRPIVTKLIHMNCWRESNEQKHKVNMDTSPSATPDRRNGPMDDIEMEAALTWMEKCIAMFPTLSYSKLAAVLMLLRFIRPAASFLLVLAGDFSQLAVVLLRIISRHTEIAAGALEVVNEKYFGRDASPSRHAPTFNNNSDNETEIKQETSPSCGAGESSLRQESIQRKVISGEKASSSVQKQKKKAPETKKTRGRAAVRALREKRLRMGLKVAHKGDSWD